MTRVLSTRQLDKTQISRLLEAGIQVECQDAISINLLETDIPKGFYRYIFTSKNGVKGFLKNRRSDHRQEDHVTCYCVGEKTGLFLKENGLFVAKIVENVRELGNYLINEAKKDPLLIFTGNRNRPELRQQLSENHIPFTEVKVYETNLLPGKFKNAYHCILFFSPSGVQSFIQANTAKNVPALCIGETTANEAQKHFSLVLIAEKPTTDAVLHKLIEIISTYSNL
jgi:uroporphyrinogen-III synthase